MLFPSGIENTGNVCFASNTLQCLLNLQVFKRALDTIGMYHTPVCQECQQGQFSLASYYDLCSLNEVILEELHVRA